MLVPSRWFGPEYTKQKRRGRRSVDLLTGACGRRTSGECPAIRRLCQSTKTDCGCNGCAEGSRTKVSAAFKARNAQMALADQRRVERAREGGAVARRLCLGAALGNGERLSPATRGLPGLKMRSRISASWRPDNGFLTTSVAPASRAF